MPLVDLRTVFLLTHPFFISPLSGSREADFAILGDRLVVGHPQRDRTGEVNLERERASLHGEA